MRPRKRVAVLDENEVSLGMRAMAVELWGYRAFAVQTAEDLAAVLQAERIDAVLAVLPRETHRSALKLAQELEAKVLTLDVKANAPGCQANVSLASTAPAIEVKETLRTLTAHKRGPKSPGTVRWQELQAARAS